MTLSRRRFLTISAAFAVAPREASAHIWQGRALGAEVSLTIRGDREASQSVLREVRQMIAEIEGLFSLYDPASALSQLNASGVLEAPDPRFIEVMEASDFAHNATDGLFDPSVQRLWAVFAAGHKPTEYFDTIGWDRVQFNAGRVKLGRGQALTFNGIAQGYATDKITELLQAHGLTDVLVNIGEHRGIGGPWRLALHDPEHGPLGTRTLRTGAIATSSAQATPLGQGGHIIHRDAAPHWSTVSVEAASATLADSLSTALILADRAQVVTMRAALDVTRITLVDTEGNLTSL